MRMRLFPRIQKPRQFVLFVLIGACSFWLPDVVIHAITRFDFEAKHLWLVTAISPATLLLTYLLLLKLARRTSFGQPGIAMMTGLWLLGGIFMMWSASFSGSGFSGFDFDKLFWTACSVIPILTIMMSMYDGSFIALVIATLGAFCILGVRISNGQDCSSREIGA